MHPAWSVKQVMKFLNRMWNRMTREQKKFYKDQSDKDRSRFDVQRKSWKQQRMIASGQGGETARAPPNTAVPAQKPTVEVAHNISIGAITQNEMIMGTVNFLRDEESHIEPTKTEREMHQLGKSDKQEND